MKTKIVAISITEKLKLINRVYTHCFSNEPHLFNSLRKENGSEIII